MPVLGRRTSVSTGLLPAMIQILLHFQHFVLL